MPQGPFGIKNIHINADVFQVSELLYHQEKQILEEIVTDIPDFNRKLIKALVEG